jgi:hypothetical protein
MDSLSGAVAMNLQWANNEPSLRRSGNRAGFPTWSWTGTFGTKIFSEVMQQPLKHCPVTLAILSDEVQTPYQSMQSSISEGDHKSPLGLRITGPIGQPTFLDGQDPWPYIGRSPFGEGSFMVLQSSEAYTTVFKLRLDLRGETSLSLTGAIAVLLQPGSEVSEYPRTYAIMLILKQRGAGYERVGITDWSNEWNFKRTAVLDEESEVSYRWYGTHERPDWIRDLTMQTVYVK